MVNISIIDDDKTLTFQMEGHANYAEKGKDIVCASISTVWYMLEEMASEHKKVITIDFENKKVVWDYENSGLKRTLVISEEFKTIYRVLEKLSNQYPKNLSLKSNCVFL